MVMRARFTETVTDTTDDAVATHVAQARKLAGMTQRELAARANVSIGLVRSVEQRRVPATAAFLGAVSKALRVSVTDLTGQPFHLSPNQDAEFHAAISGLRTELAAYDIDNFAISEVRPYPLLKEAVDRIRTYRRNASFRRLAAELLPLTGEVRAAVHRQTGRERDLAATLLCEMYYSAHSLSHKLGYADLAGTAVDRLAWAAEESGDSLWMAAAQFQRAAVLTSGGDWIAAMKFLERCRSEIEPRLSVGARSDWIAWGGLHLQSGLAASRSGRRDIADAHLAEAQKAAFRLGDDRDAVLSFGPTNVAIWSVALAVEAMDAPEALRRADAIMVPADTPKERAGHHYIDLARAWLLQGDRTKSLHALHMAKRLAPAQTRYNAMVHETIRALARAETRKVDTVTGFAVWCGITDRA